MWPDKEVCKGGKDKTALPTNEVDVDVTHRTEKKAGCSVERKKNIRVTFCSKKREVRAVFLGSQKEETCINSQLN